MMLSNVDSNSAARASHRISVILCCQGLCSILRFAALIADSSMSIAVICAFEVRCAHISASKPVPVPISSTVVACSNWVHAPSNTPSVLTAIPAFPCSMVNDLKEKCLFFNTLYLVFNADNSSKTRLIF